MRRIGFAVGMMLALAACTPAPDPAVQAMKATVAQCKIRFPFDSRTARDQRVCIRDAVQDWGHESPYVDAYLDQAVVIAAQVDAGSISADQGRAQIDEVKVHFMAQYQEQADQQQAAQAQAQAAQAQTYSAAAAILQATQPSPYVLPPIGGAVVQQPPPMFNTSCQQIGNMTNCHSQ